MAQNRMKQQEDKGRSEISFLPGDWVYLRLQPYKQASLKKGGKKKLQPKFYGPYKVIKKVGEVAYALELPTSSKIHNVFHVSSLKKVVGQHTMAQTELLKLDEEGRLQLEPESILETCTKGLRSRKITEYLIKWKKQPQEDATWENEQFIQQHPKLTKL